MRSVFAVLLSSVLLFSSLDSQAFAQNAKPVPQSQHKAGDFRPSVTASSMPEEKPAFLWECEGKQCEPRGGGGAIWVIQGKRGLAVWQYDAVADLDIERFDRQGFIVHRTDPIDSYSTHYSQGQQFKADYRGALTGNDFDGKIFVGPFVDKWYGALTDGICDGDKCPLDARHLVELGENALRAKFYSAAFLAFKAAAARGDGEGEAFAGIMLRDGAPGLTPNPTEALGMLKDSANRGSVSGALALSETYELGIGTPKDAKAADYWKDKASARKMELQAEATRTQQVQAQAQRNKATGQMIGAAAIALLFLGAMSRGSSFQGGSESGWQEGYERGQAIHRDQEANCAAGDMVECDRGGISRPDPD
jgi:TPR repeat protein